MPGAGTLVQGWWQDHAGGRAILGPVEEDLWCPQRGNCGKVTSLDSDPSLMPGIPGIGSRACSTPTIPVWTSRPNPCIPGPLAPRLQPCGGPAPVPPGVTLSLTPWPPLWEVRGGVGIQAGLCPPDTTGTLVVQWDTSTLVLH